MASQPQALNVLPLPPGYATRLHEFQENRWTLLENWWPAPGDLGAIEPMPGFSPVNTAGDQPSVNLDSIFYTEKSDQTRRAFVTGDTSCWIVTNLDGTPSLTKVKGGLTADQPFTVLTLDDRALFMNGNDSPFIYDFSSDTASAISDAGLSQPNVSGSSASVDTSSDGNVKGDVKYFVSFVDENTGEEEALSDSFGDVEAGDGHPVNLSGLPTSAGKWRRIYRTMQGGEQPFRLGTVEDDTTTTFEDDLSDTQLTAPPPLHGEPPPSSFAFGVVHFNRVFAGPGNTNNEVWWSDIEEPESYNKWSFMNVWPGDGDQLTGIARQKSGLLIFKHDHLYKALGRDPEAAEFEIVEVISSDPNVRAIGCPTHHAITSTPRGNFFYYAKGFYLIDEGCSIEYLTSGLEDELREDINGDAEETVRCKYWRDRRCVVASVPTGSSTVPDRTYFYFVDLGAWVRMDEGFDAFGVIETGADGSPPDQLQLWSHRASDTASGKIQRLDHPTATDFDGTTRVCTARLPPLFMGSPTSVTQWLSMIIGFRTVTSTAGNDANLVVNYKLDDETGSGDDVTVPLNESGVDRWKRLVSVGAMASELEVTFTYSGSKDPQINFFRVEGVPLGDIWQRS